VTVEATVTVVSNLQTVNDGCRSIHLIAFCSILFFLARLPFLTVVASRSCEADGDEVHSKHAQGSFDVCSAAPRIYILLIIIWCAASACRCWSPSVLVAGYKKEKNEGKLPTEAIDSGVGGALATCWDSGGTSRR
jgi:hypothetical protein